ncbi:MAG: 1-phosphofructokinase family hexose kinase [Acidimicrobiia bacterium]|nr:1-phosphofructokinase family hexose kinase [Acidimicrobiia bacterium]
MKPIVTLTLNPSIDAACQADTVQPIHKIRTSGERFDAGGGGINVARVIRELGGDALAVYFAGGITGKALNEMVEADGLPCRSIQIAGMTRISNVVYERSSGLEYRFVPSGPHLDQSELDRCLAEIATLDADYVVVSGSVPSSVSSDFYVEVGKVVTGAGGRLVLDTSGEALHHTLAQGVYLVKPNLRELESLAGRPLLSSDEQAAAAQELVAAGNAEIVTVSLGAEGALLATSAGCQWLRGPQVEVKSAVGAGDSFVGAMTLGLAQGRPPEDALALAVATGTATVLTMGTELCRRSDVERIYQRLLADRETGAHIRPTSEA